MCRKTELEGVNFKNKIRVAAYCRVSTDKDDQINSLENQKSYFGEYIKRNPSWELVEVYADEGVTGTSTKKRYQFNRMINDAIENKIDMIITKEISRFARNTLDSIYYTRKLKEQGVGVIFINDNINTLDSDAELRLTIMSSIAQEESRKTSDRVKWGQKRSMEKGVVFGRDMLGYDVKDGKLIINESGAEVVRLIFHKYLVEGKGTNTIARELEMENAFKSPNMKNWSNVTVLRILKNEKYCGDLVQKKTYTPSFLNHQKKINNGQEELIVIKNHHEPIISRSVFQNTQKEIKKRSKHKKYSNRYCFSHKIKCGECGKSYVVRTKKRKDNTTYKAWRCISNNTNCNSKTINEDDLKIVCQQVIKNLEFDKDKFVLNLCSIIRSAISIEENNLMKNKNQIDNLNRKKKQLINLLLDSKINDDEFNEIKIGLDNKINSLNNQIIKFDSKSVDNKISLIKDEIENIISGEQWDDTFYRAIIKKIIVYKNKALKMELNNKKEPYYFYICNLSKLKTLFDELPFEFKEYFNRHFDTSVGTEELAHLEIVGAIVYQLTKNLSLDEIKKGGYENYFIDHTTGIYPCASNGMPFNAAAFQSKGDPLADLHEDMAAEQKARVTYDNILRLVDDPDVRDPIKFLREREIVHYQRFGEGLRIATDKMNDKNFYAINPSFDKTKK